MKKFVILAICLIGIVTTSYAQLKMHNNGNISFMRPGTGQPSSPISLASGSNSKYFVSYVGNWNGIYCNITDDTPTVSGKNYGGYFYCDNENAETNLGLHGKAGTSYATSSNNNAGSVGLWGECNCYFVDRYGYGVLGKGYGTFNTAAICGIASGSSASSAIPDDKYAGLFVGKTKVIGALVTVSSLADVSLGNAALSSSGGSEVLADRGELVSDLMLGLNARSFRHAPAAKQAVAEPTFLEKSEEEKEELAKKGIDISKLDEPEEDVIARQIEDKQHYGFSADELEKVFPDLVYEDKDGSKKINYVEMVPLLVQCINELNGRIRELEGGKTRETRAADTPDDETAAPIPAKSSGNVLFQNSPNPFREQTTIRFRLADDARNAQICIFDLSGKMLKKVPVTAGMESITVNGWELGEGIYLYSLVVDGQEIDTKRMLITK